MQPAFKTGLHRKGVRAHAFVHHLIAALAACTLSLACTAALAAGEHDHGAKDAQAASAGGDGAAAGSAGKASPAKDAPAAAAPAGTMVDFKSGSETAKGYLARPSGTGMHPAVIVIQEWWGLDANTKRVADRFASQGYVALAPDLYRGKLTDKPEEALELARSLPEARAVADLMGAFAYLRAHAAVGTRPIGSAGFCMGGRLSLLLAEGQPDLRACVICYGRLDSDPAKLAPIKASVLGVFGGADKGIPTEMIEGFRSAMQSAGKSVEIKVFPEAGHAFMNPNNPGHKPAETKLAWDLIDTFLASNLRGK